MWSRATMKRSPVSRSRRRSLGRGSAAERPPAVRPLHPSVARHSSPDGSAAVCGASAPTDPAGVVAVLRRRLLAPAGTAAVLAAVAASAAVVAFPAWLGRDGSPIATPASAQERDLGSGRRLVAVVADLHLGLGRDGAGAWRSDEDFRWADEFGRFLDALDAEGGGATDLVLNGDTFDLTRPADAGCVHDDPGLGCTEPEALARLDRVLTAHRGRRGRPRGVRRVGREPGLPRAGRARRGAPVSGRGPSRRGGARRTGRPRGGGGGRLLAVGRRAGPRRARTPDRLAGRPVRGLGPSRSSNATAAGTWRGRNGRRPSTASSTGWRLATPSSTTSPTRVRV